MPVEREPQTAEEWKAAYFQMMKMRDTLRKELEEAQNKIQHLEAEGVKWIERIAAQRDACAAGPWEKGHAPNGEKTQTIYPDTKYLNRLRRSDNAILHAKINKGVK